MPLVTEQRLDLVVLGYVSTHAALAELILQIR